MIRSAEGSIEQSTLDAMISKVMKRHGFNPDVLGNIRNAVIDDYQDSNISEVTSRDIVEIIDASGFEPEYEGED